MIGNGNFGYVYEAVEIDSGKKIAIKGFVPSSDPKSMERDLNRGFDPRLHSEYTMIYAELFDFNGCMFAVMPLMKNSLFQYLNPYIVSKPKKFLSDEV
jgi:serine/threonine protein kinase